MGCSASRLDSLVAKAIEDPSFSLSPHFSSTSSSTKTTSSSSSATSKPRSLAAPLVHHPALGKGDTPHLVSLTSTTYGSLILVDKNHPSSLDTGDFACQSSPDSVINTWELMEGLEDHPNFTCDSGNDFKLTSLTCCDLKDAGAPTPNPNPNPTNISTLRLGLNFTDSLSNTLSDSYVFVEMPQVQGQGQPRKLDEGDSNSNDLTSKPLWKLLSEESLLSKMDPNVVSSYQRALSTRNLGYNPNPNPTPSPCSRLNNPVGSSLFCPTTSKSMEESSPLDSKLSVDANANASKGVGCSGEDKIVLYFTSLRGIRRTYEDCCAVRLILRGFRVVMDERDISMDSTYKKELQSALGGGALSLPHLFVRGKPIGGADEIKQLHETGELERLLDGFPVQDCSFVCDICGDARFIPCSSCNGSRKVFLKQQGHTNRCPDCNENGLIHCPGCCS